MPRQAKTNSFDVITRNRLAPVVIGSGLEKLNPSTSSRLLQDYAQ